MLVCGKCEKKLGGGFGPGGDQRLSRLLRKRQAGFDTRHDTLLTQLFGRYSA